MKRLIIIMFVLLLSGCGWLQSQICPSSEEQAIYELKVTLQDLKCHVPSDVDLKSLNEDKYFASKENAQKITDNFILLKQKKNEYKAAAECYQNSIEAIQKKIEENNGTTN